MVESRHLDNASIINAECVALRDGVLAAILNGFFNLKIEGDFKVIINCYNKKSSIPSSIILLIEDIWGLDHNLDIFNCCHIYRKANRITYCLRKVFVILIQLFGGQSFLKMLENLLLKIIVELFLIVFVECLIYSPPSPKKKKKGKGGQPFRNYKSFNQEGRYKSFFFN